MAKTKFAFLLLAIISFFILWGRLFFLQIIQGKVNQESSLENRIRITLIPSLRGIIYDKNNKVLVRNTVNGREYLFPDIFSHVLGYIGLVGEELGFKPNELVGKTGIEKEYDQILRGKDGRLLVETNNEGEVIREIQREEPVSGQDIYLNLDFDLQNKATSLLKGKKGGVVATNPKTGAVLILVSSPYYDPNLFTINNKDNLSLANLFKNENKPMFNRIISGLYPPGSTYKIITSLAGLEEGAVTENTTFEDTGIIKIGSYSYGNWYYLQYGGKDGMVNLVKALQRSNDIYFYKLGESLGIEKLISWSQKLGLGKPTGIDLGEEEQGLLPTPEWKKATKTEGWYLGDTYITSIGQGNLLLTPLQVNQMTSIIANKGISCVPYLNKNKEKNCTTLKIEQKNIDAIQKGMVMACSAGGTASVFFDFKPLVACKTGTAEYGLTGTIKGKNQTHAWFTVYAPSNDPEIVLTVLLEGAGEGSKEAAPIAKEILKYYFGK